MRKSFTLLAALVATSFANDARVNALAGSPVFSDASDMYRNPAYISQYKIIQGNIIGAPAAGADEYVAAGIATWHISDNLMLGGYYNENEDRASLFTTAGATTGGYANPARKNVPHLLFGVKLGDAVTIGLDGSYEGSIYKENTDADEIKNKTMVIGAKLGAIISTEALDIDVSAGTNLPSSKNQSKTKVGTSTLDTITLDNKGFQMFADARATVKLQDDFRLLAGIDFDFEKTQDKKTKDPVDPKMTTIGILLGTAKDFENDMTLCLSAKFESGKMSYTNSDDIDAGKAATFKAAAEKSFGETRMFDTHSFRIGYSHAFTRISEVQDNGETGTEKNPSTEVKNPGFWSDSAANATPTDIGLTLGAGMTRGKFGLDLFVSSGDFNFADQQSGILGLMPVAGATLTMDFAKKGTAVRAKK